MRPSLGLAALLIVLPLASAGAAPSETSTNAEANAAYKDIQNTLGSVPGFFKAFPANAIAGAWEEFKAVELADTAIPNKYKELIALAVAAQIPCKYCIYAHTSFAKLNGATDAEIAQVVAEASLTRYWSTWINGLQPDEAAFRADVTKSVQAMKKAMEQPASAAAAPMTVTDAKSALADIQQTMGFVPEFMKMMPPAALPGAWKTMKAIELTEGAVPQKYVSLASLAVASQVPCRYCVIADSEFSKLGGASEAERHDAILMAAHTRQWSTYLAGIQYDEAKFRREIDKVVTDAKKKMAATASR